MEDINLWQLVGIGIACGGAVLLVEVPSKIIKWGFGKLRGEAPMEIHQRKEPKVR